MRLLDVLTFDELYSVLEAGFEGSSKLPLKRDCFVTSGNVVHVFDFKDSTKKARNREIQTPENLVISIIAEFENVRYKPICAVQFLHFDSNFNQLAAIKKLSEIYPCEGFYIKTIHKQQTA